MKEPERMMASLLLAATCVWAALAGGRAAAPAQPGAVAPEADGLIASPEPGWPQWRGVRRDAVSNEKGLLPAWPEGGPKLLWKVGELGRGWASPIIAGGAIYIPGDVGDELVIHAFDLGGKPKWKMKNGAAWKGQWPGARACPAWSDRVLYHMNAHGRVAALDTAAGKELWSVDVLQRFGSRNIIWAMSECLLVDGPRVIVTPGGPRTMMAALDKKTGRTVWMSEPIPGDMATHCSPVLFRHAGRRILASCSSHHAFGVDADTGRLLWSVPFRNMHGVTAATPVFDDGSVFYTATDGPGGVRLRIDAGGGGLRTAVAWSSPIDALTGGAVLREGVLFACGCKVSKTLQAIDWKTGQTRYELRLAEGRSNWAASAMVWADGRLYCQVEDGGVAMLRPKLDGFEVAGRFQLTPARGRDAWTHPVLLDGRLYLRYHDTLWCYDVRGR